MPPISQIIICTFDVANRSLLNSLSHRSRGCSDNISTKKPESMSCRKMCHCQHPDVVERHDERVGGKSFSDSKNQNTKMQPAAKTSNKNLTSKNSDTNSIRQYSRIGAGSERIHSGKAGGLANPAAVFCGQAGGRLQLGTRHAYCTLPGGRSIEQWTLMRSANEKCQELGGRVAVFQGGQGACISKTDGRLLARASDLAKTA